MPLCLVNHDLTIQDAITLLDLLLHQKPKLDHHSTFLACPLSKPTVEEQKGNSECDTIVLPSQAGIVHCHLQSNQVLTVFQPRFEDGVVYRCTRNGLQLSVCECTDLILFLTGQIDVFDLFQTAPKGRIVATWQADVDVSSVKQSNHSSSRHALEKHNSAMSRKLNSPVQPSHFGASETYTPSQHSAPASQHTPHSHHDDSVETRAPKDADKHLSPPNLHNAETSSTVIINKRIQDTLDALVRKVPIPKLPSTSDTSNERTKPEDLNDESRQQQAAVRRRSNLQNAPRQTGEKGNQLVINPAVNPATQQKQELYSASAAASVSQTYPDPSGDCHMQEDYKDYKVLKYFEQEIPSVEQPPSADAEDPAELTVVFPSPLTAIDSSSALEESQELKLIVELDTQLANHLTATHHPSTLPAFETVSETPDSREVDARLDSNQIKEIHMPDVESTAAPANQTTVQNIREAEGSSTDHIEESSLVGCTAEHLDRKDQHRCIPAPTEGVNATRKIVKATCGFSGQTGPITSLSFAERRQLTHIHALKQVVSLDVSLTNMAFDEQDYRQAAVIYENLNSTACFYTTALRLLSKSDWSMQVEFEDHIVHQAMKAVAHGWTLLP